MSDVRCRNILHHHVGQVDLLRAVYGRRLTAAYVDDALADCTHMRGYGFVARPGHDDVVRHRQQTFPLTPSRDLRPRIGAHYEKELGRVAPYTLKVRDCFNRVASIQSVELVSRDRELRIILRRERQHRITMYRLGYRPPDLVRRHLGREKKYFLNLK